MPLTMRQHEANLHQPALCELLPIRDYLDNVIVRSNGALVAGYDLGGINSYYHSDETRNQTKYSLEALVRSLTERSMRMQVRFEVVEGLGDLPRQVQGSTSLGQSGGAEPGPPPLGGLEARRSSRASFSRRCCTRTSIGIRGFITRHPGTGSEAVWARWAAVGASRPRSASSAASANMKTWFRSSNPF